MNYCDPLYPSTIYRVTVKGIIKNKSGLILATRDDGETEFELPGGGVEHGETIHAALTRELREEFGFSGEFRLGQLFHVNTNFKDGMWRMALMFWLEIEDESLFKINKFELGCGEAAEVAWVQPEVLARGNHNSEETAKKMLEL